MRLNKTVLILIIGDHRVEAKCLAICDAMIMVEPELYGGCDQQ